MPMSGTATAPTLRQKSQRMSDHAERFGRDPSELKRAASLSLEKEHDELARLIEEFEEWGFDYLVCGWPSGGRAVIEPFAERFLAN